MKVKRTFGCAKVEHIQIQYQGAKMLLSFKRATHNLNTFSYDFRGFPLTNPASSEVLEDMNGVLQIGVQGFHALISADRQNLARLSLGGDDQT